MLPDLRINPPRLEPDRVLLEQLSQLSRASAPVAGPGRASRSLMSAATVLVVASISWLTGTLPGIASPFDRQPAHQPTQQHAPLTPSGEQPRPGAEVPPLVVPPGQAKPHQNNGNHLGQVKPHQNSGNHTGQTKPQDTSGGQGAQGSTQGGGQANGHRS